MKLQDSADLLPRGLHCLVDQSPQRPGLSVLSCTRFVDLFIQPSHVAGHLPVVLKGEENCICFS